MAKVHFSAVGHLTVDELEAGEFAGGSVLYAGLAAHALGAEVLLSTSLGKDFPGHPDLNRPGITVEALPSAHTTRFIEQYANGQRQARVLQQALPLPYPPVDAPAAEGAAHRVHFVCPVLDEVPRDGWTRSEGTLLAAGLQGWLRRLDARGHVLAAPLGHLDFLDPFDVVFCSDEDLGASAERDRRRMADRVRCLVVTEGARGACLYLAGRPHRVSADPTVEQDPTGAGDTFAACFLMALASEKDPLEAAVWGACGAARAVAAPGTQGLAQLRTLATDVERYRRTLPWPMAT